MLVDLNDRATRRRAARRRPACSSSPAPAPARPPRSPTASPTSSRAAPTRGASCCSPSRAAPPPRCSRRVEAVLAARGRGAGGASEPRLGRHLPRRGRPPAAHPRARHRPGARLHDHGPRRLRGPHARRAHRARPRARRLALPAEVHVPRHLLALRQRPAAARRGAAHGVPVVPQAEDDLAQLFAAYTDAKEEQQVLDYDDLLLFWHGLLADPAGGARVRERFDHVLVDEYQDTNALQADIVSLLRPDGTGVTCVGDDAQAIYGFRAATVRNILDFEQRFPGAEVVTLTQNYRCTRADPRGHQRDHRRGGRAPRQGAVDRARRTARAPSLVTCRDEDEQTQWLCERILEHREQGTLLKQQAVLFRAQHHSLALEMELCRRNIPFHKYGGLRFVEMAHVKDLVSFLRLAENPSDAMAGLRVLGLVPGIGPKTAAALLESLSAAAGDFPAAWSGARVPEPARAAWPAVVELFATLARRRPARRARAGPRRAQRLRAAARARATTTSRRACATSSRSRASPPAAQTALAVPRRAGARPAGVHAGPRRPAAPRRGLPHPLHHALGQGPRVRRRLRHPRRRRQHPLGHGHRQRRRRSRRSAGCSTSPARAPASSCTSAIPCATTPSRGTRPTPTATPSARGSSPSPSRLSSSRSRRGPRTRRATRTPSSASPPRPFGQASARSGRRRPPSEGRPSCGRAAAPARPVVAPPTKLVA